MAVKLGELLSDSPKRMVVAADTPPMVCRCSAGLPPWIDRSVKVSPAVPPTSCECQGVGVGLPTPPAAPRIMPGCKRGEVDAQPARRHVVDDLLGHDFLHVGAADVDERRLPAHGDGFRQLADTQFDVHGGDERTAELDAVALGGAEPGQGEGGSVGAREELDDLVSPRAIGHCGANFLDQDGTSDLDGDPGKNGSRCVSHDSADGRLGVGRGWRQSQTQQHPDKGTLHLGPPCGGPDRALTGRILRSLVAPCN